MGLSKLKLKLYKHECVTHIQYTNIYLVFTSLLEKKY